MNTRILIVDDSPVLRLIMRRAVLQAGASADQVFDANNGQEAWDFVSEQSVDLILLDLHMPIMDGAAAIEAIRKYERASGTEPVRMIVLSADGQASARDLALEAGADDFLVKPLDLDAVGQLLSDLQDRTLKKPVSH